MNKKNEKKNKDIFINPKKISAVPGVVFFVFVSVLAFALLMITLYRGGMITLPPFIESVLGISDGRNDPVSEDSGASLLSSVRAAEPERKAGEIFSLSKDELSKITDEAEPPESYLHELTVAYYHGDTQNSYKAEVIKYKTKYKITCETSDGAKKEVIFDGERLHIRSDSGDPAAARSIVLSENSEFSLYSETGIPNLKDLFSMLNEAGESPSLISDYDIELQRTQNENLVIITFGYTDTNTSEIYKISLETGVISSAESYINETLYYTMNTTNFQESYIPDESIFEVEE